MRSKSLPEGKKKGCECANMISSQLTSGRSQGRADGKSQRGDGSRADQFKEKEEEKQQQNIGGNQKKRQQNMLAVVKVYRAEERYQRQAREEISNLRSLRNCPHVTRLYDSFEYQGSACLVLEKSSHTLQELLWATGGFGSSPEMIRYIFSQILDGVDAIHSAGFCHGDLKPSNIGWIADSVSVRILDFGLTFSFEKGPHHCIETRGYRSPEASCWNAIVSGRAITIGRRGTRKRRGATAKCKTTAKASSRLEGSGITLQQQQQRKEGGGEPQVPMIKERLLPLIHAGVDVFAIGVIGCQVMLKFSWNDDVLPEEMI